MLSQANSLHLGSRPTASLAATGYGEVDASGKSSDDAHGTNIVNILPGIQNQTIDLIPVAWITMEPTLACVLMRFTCHVDVMLLGIGEALDLLVNHTFVEHMLTPTAVV